MVIFFSFIFFPFYLQVLVVCCC
uniref:Uncharacterized protein n=1 Tax=Rhizophora mucronata TaxID=61149 RepID=A0A2P2KFW3_RHIMU